jgi:hypothetical protein
MVQTDYEVKDLDKNELAVESLKLLQDWSKWLVTLEAAICAALWSTLTSGGKPSALLYLGWGMFWGSIIAAAILLIAISVYARRVDISGDSDFKKLWVLVGIEYALFLGGLLCFAWRLAEVWLSS